MLLTADLDMRFVPSTEVHVQPLEGEAVLLDVSSGLYFGLNPVGSRVWELIGEGVTLGAMLDTLETEFDAARDELGRDIPAFVTTLVERGLLRRA